MIKSIGPPGSLGFLAVGALVCVILMIVSARTRRIGKALLIALLTIYLILSIPVVSRVIAGAEGARQAAPASSFGKLDEIFVFDGDNFQARARLAVEIAASSKPGTVWVLGGGDLRNALIAHGLPPSSWEWGGGPSRTTSEQLEWVDGYMRRHGTRRAAVIVSRFQAPRVLGLARRQNLDIIVIPAPADDEPPPSGVRSWLPDLGALAVSRDGLYERLALAYYRWKGWL